MWRLTTWGDSDFTSSFSPEVMASYILPPTKQRWVTATCFTPGRGQFVCGDRGGNVYVYHIDNTRTKVSNLVTVDVKLLDNI